MGRKLGIQHTLPGGVDLLSATGPNFKGTGFNTDWPYVQWVGRYDSLGIGKKNVPVVPGTNSDSLQAFLPDTGQWVMLRVPYPMGFSPRLLDGRIDDPKTGWKGRGLWSGYDSFVNWHTEGGKGTKPKAVKFQMRPNPLASRCESLA